MRATTARSRETHRNTGRTRARPRMFGAIRRVGGFRFLAGVCDPGSAEVPASQRPTTKTPELSCDPRFRKVPTSLRPATKMPQNYRCVVHTLRRPSNSQMVSIGSSRNSRECRTSHAPRFRRTSPANSIGSRRVYDKTKLALWCTFHPSETTRERFLVKCRELISRSVRFSVGVVGWKEHFNDIETLRSELPPEVTCR